MSGDDDACSLLGQMAAEIYEEIRRPGSAGALLCVSVERRAELGGIEAHSAIVGNGGDPLEPALLGCMLVALYKTAAQLKAQSSSTPLDRCAAKEGAHRCEMYPDHPGSHVFYTREGVLIRDDEDEEPAHRGALACVRCGNIKARSLCAACGRCDACVCTCQPTPDKTTKTARAMLEAAIGPLDPVVARLLDMPAKARELLERALSGEFEDVPLSAPQITRDTVARFEAMNTAVKGMHESLAANGCDDCDMAVSVITVLVQQVAAERDMSQSDVLQWAMAVISRAEMLRRQFTAKA